MENDRMRASKRWTKVRSWRALIGNGNERGYSNVKILQNHDLCF